MVKHWSGALFVAAALFSACASSTAEIHEKTSQTNTTKPHPHVAVVYYNESFTKPLALLAAAVAAGAEAAGADARLLSVNGAWPYSAAKGGEFTTQIDQEKDLLQWADAIALGAPVINGNPAGGFLSWQATWDYKDPRWDGKLGAAFATGGGIAQGVESVVLALQRSLMTFRMVIIGGAPAQGGSSGTYGPIAVTDSPPWFTTGQDNGTSYTENKITPVAFAKSAFMLGHKLARAAGAAGKPLREAMAPRVNNSYSGLEVAVA